MKKIFCILLIVVLMTGCNVSKQDGEKLRDLDFTVVKEGEVPKELADIIEEKKTGTCKLTYTDAGSLYIVVGYGEQPTGGYSIAVNEIYLSKNAIYVDTNLIGPSKDENITQVITYPYIVIKTENIDRSVVFK